MKGHVNEMKPHMQKMHKFCERSKPYNLTMNAWTVLDMGDRAEVQTADGYKPIKYFIMKSNSVLTPTVLLMVAELEYHSLNLHCTAFY